MTDLIDDVEFQLDYVDMDSGTPTVAAYLTITGDFANEAENYLVDTETDTMTFRINREQAEKLKAQITEAL